MNPKQPKPIPTIATRAEIYEMYSKLTRKYVRTAIQHAIVTVDENNRYSKHIKVLNSRHIAIIVNELGDAPGYEPVPDLITN